MTTPMLENLGLSGFAFTGADVGGFAGSPSMPLLTKWLEVAAFQPIDRDHTEKGSADQEPWVGGPEQEAIRRRFIEARYRLMPYLYTLAEEASRTGLPMVRPLFLEFPHAATDGHPIDTDAPGEFLLGSDILVAAPPFPDEVEPYQAEFPTALWYDYWTGERVPQPRPHLNRPIPLCRPVPQASSRSPRDSSRTSHSPRLRPRRRYHPHRAARPEHQRNPAGPAHPPHLCRRDPLIRAPAASTSTTAPATPTNRVPICE